MKFTSLALSAALFAFFAFTLSPASTLAQTTQNSVIKRKLSPKQFADLLFLQGRQQFLDRQYEDAIQSLEQALMLYRAMKDPRGEVIALIVLGPAYRRLGNTTKAVEISKQALAIARELKDPELEESALAILAAAQWRSSPQKAKADELLNQGLQQFQTSQFAAASQSWHQALQIYRLIKDRSGEGRTLDNLGLIYRVWGNFAKAVEHHEQSVAIFREIQDQRREGMSLGSLGNAYVTLGNYGRAVKYYEQSLTIFRVIQDRERAGLILGNVGSVYRKLGEYSRAIEFHQQSVRIFREIRNQREEGRALANLGSVYSLLGDYRQAMKYHIQSLEIVRKINDRQAEGSILGELGSTHHALSEYAKAIEYHQQGLAIDRAIKDRNGEGITLSNLGLALFKARKLTAAQQILFDGIAVWESIRQTGVGNNDANKVSIFETQASTYRILQQVLVAQNKTNAALEIAERGRARAFVELLAQRLRDQESGARSQEPSIRNQEPGVKPPGLQQIQQIAKAQNATLVQYSIIVDEFKIQNKQEVRQSELYIWVVPPTGEITFRTVDLKPLWQQQNSSLEALVEQSRDTIGARGRADVEVVLSPEFLGRQQEKQTRNLKQLHELLIQPIADLLPKDPNQRVIFMPQGELFLVPFPALLDASGKALIEQHTILTAPSIQVLELTRQQRKAVGSRESGVGKALIVGNPTMPKVVTKLGEPPVQLSSLPGAKQEALEIAKLLNTQAITGGQATETTIVQQMPAATIIHFATHGLLDDTKGLGVPGAIALAPSGTGELNDGLLTSDEILDMKLKMRNWLS